MINWNVNRVQQLDAYYVRGNIVWENSVFQNLDKCGTIFEN